LPKPLRRSTRPTLHRRSAALAAAAFAAAGLLAGCTGQTEERSGADTNAGKELFVQKCGGCHTLAEAGTLGATGPNLDWAFGASRDEGFAEDTFFEVVLEQMKIPGEDSPMPEFDNPDDEANYLSEADLQNIAAYVAAVAGTDVKAAATDPKSMFVASCGSCHTLADAGTTGTVGPNLDDAQPTLDKAVAQITNGGGAMPAFEGKLTDAQIKALAEYVVQATGGR
jgi:cbb3-type cytochrome c oxidase subunit III